MESEVLRVKRGISDNLNQLQFISIVYIWHWQYQMTVHVTHRDKIDKNWTLNQIKCLYQATLENVRENKSAYYLSETCPR